jgi:hypothetical protein
MPFRFGFVLVVLSSIFFGSFIRKPKNDNLIFTKWNFIGFIRKDSIHRYPEEYRFTLEFSNKNKTIAEAFWKHYGKYKIKGNKIFIEARIGVSYSSSLELLPGGSGKAMQLMRLYQSGLSMNGFNHFEVIGNELKINSEWGTMLFSKIEN